MLASTSSAIFLAHVAQLQNVGMAGERVVVEVHLGVERKEPAVSRGDEGIDLNQRRVGVFGGARQRHHELHRAADVLRLEAEAERDLARLERPQPKAGQNVLFDNRAGIFRGDFFDLHAARRRRHEDVAAIHAVEQHAEVKLARDGQRLFDQQPLHRLAFRAGLMRDQLHAEHLGRQLAGFLRRLGQLDAAALAAAAGMNLGFDDHAGRAVFKQLARRVQRLFARLDHLAARHGHAILPKNGLSLIFVNFHVGITTAGFLPTLTRAGARLPVNLAGVVYSLRGWRNSRKPVIV